MPRPFLTADFTINFARCDPDRFAELEADIADHFARPSPGPFELVLYLDPPITVTPVGRTRTTTYGANLTPPNPKAGRVSDGATGGRTPGRA